MESRREYVRSSESLFDDASPTSAAISPAQAPSSQGIAMANYSTTSLNFSPPEASTGSPSPPLHVVPNVNGAAVTDSHQAATATSQQPTPSGEVHQGTSPSPGPSESTNLDASQNLIQQPSFMIKIGGFFLTVLLVGTALIFGSIGFLIFLWSGSERNSLWHTIVVREWLTNAVAICAEIIKQSVNFQVGIAGAILAAMALERHEVHLTQAASMIMIRAGAEPGSLLRLARMRLSSIKRMGWRNLTLPALILLFAVNFLFAQVITIILVTDIGLSPVPGKLQRSSIPFGFTFKTGETHPNQPEAETIVRGTNWLRQPSIYPMFAEYSEPPFVADGISDTGVTVRAFLPFQAAQKRETLQKYNGKTTVLDSRVTCQVPLLENAILNLEPERGRDLILQANVFSSTNTPRLATGSFNYTPSITNVWGYRSNLSVPVICLAGIAQTVQNADQWRTSLCQLGEPGAGGLVSEFKNLSSWNDTNSARLTESRTYGTAYLILNVSSGSSDNWRAVVGQRGGARPPSYSLSGEWMNLIYSRGALILSVTLCYSAFDIADIPVAISSNKNRTESSPLFMPNSSRYSFDALRKQYGQFKTESNVGRNILSLEKQSWIAGPDEVTPENTEPYVRGYANFQWPVVGADIGNRGNFTGYLWQAETPGKGVPGSKTDGTDSFDKDIPWLAPDPMHIWLFQEIMVTGGSIAFALQSLITLLSSMAYYDQLGQFDKSGSIDQTFFVTANVPQRNAGLISVAAMLAVHLIVLGGIVLMFAKTTRFSLLDNSWTGLSQADTADMKEMVDVACMATDEQVEKLMKSGNEKLRVGIRNLNTNRVGIALTERQVRV